MSIPPAFRKCSLALSLSSSMELTFDRWRHILPAWIPPSMSQSPEALSASVPQISHPARSCFVLPYFISVPLTPERPSTPGWFAAACTDFTTVDLRTVTSERATWCLPSCTFLSNMSSTAVQRCQRLWLPSVPAAVQSATESAVHVCTPRVALASKSVVSSHVFQHTASQHFSFFAKIILFKVSSQQLSTHRLAFPLQGPGRTTWSPHQPHNSSETQPFVSHASSPRAGAHTSPLATTRSC